MNRCGNSRHIDPPCLPSDVIVVRSSHISRCSGFRLLRTPGSDVYPLPTWRHAHTCPRGQLREEARSKAVSGEFVELRWFRRRFHGSWSRHQSVQTCTSWTCHLDFSSKLDLYSLISSENPVIHRNDLIGSNCRGATRTLYPRAPACASDIPKYPPFSCSMVAPSQAKSVHSMPAHTRLKYRSTAQRGGDDLAADLEAKEQEHFKVR